MIKEIRDEQTRNYLLALPFEVTIHEESYLDPAMLSLASNFAKDTGDYKSLSQTDLKVIALGVQLAREQGELGKVKREPKPLQEFRPKRFQKDYERQ